MNVLISLTALGMIAMFGGVLKIKHLLLPLTLTGIAIALFFALQGWNLNQSFFNSMMRMDNFAITFAVVALLGSFFVFLFYYDFFFQSDIYFSEVYGIITFSLIGVVVMVSFTNLLMLFLGVEILSLSLYVLAGLNKRDLLSNEASLKYFLMGAFSTGFLLFGMAMLYGAAGSFSTENIAYYIGLHQGAVEPLVVAGIILLMIGLFFKMAAAPFHFWTPDVYQGSPTLITGYMATIGKVAAVAAFLRLFQLSFAPVKETYQPVFWVVAMITMFVGNIIAIYQNNIKRMLAYSSIAHAGYMLIALMSLNTVANGAVLYYSIAYTLASLTAFVVVVIVREKRGSENSEAFNGLSKSNPVLAIVLAVAMISLSGIPPTAGFFAKFYIFSAAIKDGWVWIVVLAVINSFISVFYYFRPVIAAYMRKGNEEKLTVKAGTLALLVLLTLLTLLLGLFPGWISGMI